MLLMYSSFCLALQVRVASAQEEWMPDPNLREAVRRKARPTTEYATNSFAFRDISMIW